MFGGFTGSQLCVARFGSGQQIALVIDLVSATFSGIATSTTTTTRHGLNGAVISSSSATSPVSLGGYTGGYVGCSV